MSDETHDMIEDSPSLPTHDGQVSQIERVAEQNSLLPSLTTLSNLASVELADERLRMQHEHVSRSHLKKTLSLMDLTLLGVGCTIGAGVFLTTGILAKDKTGPALCFAYIIAGLVCVPCGLAYGELAAMSPAAGSAYSYVLSTLGGPMAWVIGFDLILEYAVAAASVAAGWSHYFTTLMSLIGLQMPKSISKSPLDFDNATHSFTATGAVCDLPALFIIWAITLLLVIGVKESARVNAVIVAVKTGVILLVIFAGLAFVSSANFTPFAPYGFFSLSFFGNRIVGSVSPDGTAAGVMAGAAVAFFSFVGFDAVSTSAEEAKNPQRDVPGGMMLSLLISLILYVGVSLVLVGMVPYTELSVEAPVSAAFRLHGARWAEGIIAIGALVGMSSVLLVTLQGQARIFYSMSRDGFLPPIFNRVHSLYKTPLAGQVIVGIFCSLLIMMFPLGFLVEVVSIGTLSAFCLVCVSVLLLRKWHPDLPRPFRCPWMPWMPIAGIVSCLFLMISLPSSNWLRLIVWFLIGQVSDLVCVMYLCSLILWGAQFSSSITFTRRNIEHGFCNVEHFRLRIRWKRFLPMSKRSN